jgi:hypothetical protein
MRHATRSAGLAVLALAGASDLSPSHAGPAESLLSPVVVQGERDAELKAGTAKLRDGTRLNEEELAQAIFAKYALVGEFWSLAS